MQVKLFHLHGGLLEEVVEVVLLLLLLRLLLVPLLPSLGAPLPTSVSLQRGLRPRLDKDAASVPRHRAVKINSIWMNVFTCHGSRYLHARPALDRERAA